MPESSAPTLFEDWQTRRARLRERPHAGGEALAPAQIHVLEYLIKRYEGSPEAAQPARFPLPSELILKQRTIVVHHHLGRGIIAGVKTMEEAKNRVSSILKRISDEHPQESLGSDAAGSIFSFGTEAWSDDRRSTAGKLNYFKFMKVLPDNWRTTIHQLSKSDKQFLASICHHRLLGQAFKWDYAFSYLDAIEVLKLLQNPESHTFTHTSWVECSVFSGHLNLPKLEELMSMSFMRAESLEHFRAELANTSHSVRSRALLMIASIGNMHDIGLLSDLSNLPPQEDEYPGERESLLDAMRNLSERPA